ncbi:PmeII family type II restriction endonuclease [Alkalibacillus silvisoli]|uniref:Type II restriction endonuclease EcoO109IR domain-containing protein n=1 Tax=Alkalibacillus silvisoli TaxID=392823 RepID=A0ABN0ZPE9_9BACI
MRDNSKQASLSEEDLNIIIENTKKFFRDEIIPSHIENTKKLRKLSEFQKNPFLDKYKASFLTGKSDSVSIAKAMIYPRILGTSINTSFGTRFQKYCTNILEGFASTTSGIDIEFIDKIDGRKKYCQLKAGPNTINADDVNTLKNHFSDVKNLARTNNLNVGLNDLVVGVFYGESEDLSGHYKKVNEDYPVIIGKEFWERLTGKEDFYDKLTDAIVDVANEADGSELIEETIEKLAKQIDSEGEF